MTGTALVVTGGHSHPPEMSADALGAVLAGAGLVPSIVGGGDEIEAGLVGLARAAPDLVVVNALRWTMGHPRYLEHRYRWALSLSAAARRSLSRWVEGGGRLLALHTALVCFDDWPGWADLIGGAWDWDRSWHPPLGPVEVQVRPDHAITVSNGEFTVTDECYVDLDLRPGNEVIATMTVVDQPPQPAAWLRRSGLGRVAVSTLGHDTRSLDHPAHRAMLTGLVGWLLADGDDEREEVPT